ncbi:contact-dependent growth inhibition system immunity protein [Pantoea sp.]|uniref:contact-dependent growth inhibition system immunity protein n=1 Tax=Pantoea sp. TaxID=69393 RepID=UPI0028AD81FE|nr:contact-dependent growth inhibition system immunity protein [Pantoea sp.]
MTTFNALLRAQNIYDWPTDRSSLDSWFFGILDIPLDELSVGDLARSIRQNLFLEQVLPKAEVYLRDDVLAGEHYEGELLYAISLLSKTQANPVLTNLNQISDYLSTLDKAGFDSQAIESIERIARIAC